MLESGYLDAEPEELTRVMECAVRANKHERERTRETSPFLDRSLGGRSRTPDSMGRNSSLGDRGIYVSDAGRCGSVKGLAFRV